MKGDVLLQNIQVRGFMPSTAGRNAKVDRRKVVEAIETKLGKNIENVRKRCSGKPISLNVVFYLLKNSTQAKKDLDSLTDVLLDVLSKELETSKEPGLDIVNDESVIYRFVLEKKIVDAKKDEGFAFSIYEWSEA